MGTLFFGGRRCCPYNPGPCLLGVAQPTGLWRACRDGGCRGCCQPRSEQDAPSRKKPIHVCVLSVRKPTALGLAQGSTSFPLATQRREYRVPRSFRPYSAVLYTF